MTTFISITDASVYMSNSEHFKLSSFSPYILGLLFWFSSKSKVLNLTGNNRFKQRWFSFSKFKWNKIIPLFLFQKSFFPVTDKVKTVPRLLRKLSSNSHLISTVFGIRSTCTELDTKSVLALSLLFLEY